MKKDINTQDSIYLCHSFFDALGWKSYPFQEEAWLAVLSGKNGFVNAPTGSGKTYSLALPIIAKALKKEPKKGELVFIWVTPIKALAKEIKIAIDRIFDTLALDWTVEIRSGDTSSSKKANLWKNPPQVLITTPESIHVMLATKGYISFFSHLQAIVVDEWHELMGSKRGVQMELALSRMRGLNSGLITWAISATIGNMEDALKVFFGITYPENTAMIKAKINKKILVETVFPDEIDSYPWAGHIGLQMVHKVIPLIYQSRTCLIFTNTRAQSEIWYQRILEVDPELSGLLAMHHGSISKEIRDWVEENLYHGTLKAVVCTSSLDLGVDFRPVDTVIQIGSPKGVSRFIQRAGRSGHAPGEISKIYFVPTHSLELIESAALKTSIKESNLEDRIPYIRSFDVLMQYLMTLAVSEGFNPNQIYREINNTFCFNSVTDVEFQSLLNYLVYGAASLEAYDEYHKMIVENGVYKVVDKRVALRHRLSIGTIVSEAMMQVKYMKGKWLGSVEEWFISQLKPNESFWFAGRPLELLKVKEMTAYVQDSSKQNGKIPSYLGGRLSLTSQLSSELRNKMDQYLDGITADEEIRQLTNLFATQQHYSLVPRQEELLIEYFQTKEGYHLIIYPFEGRSVHEGMAALIAQRISTIIPISFSIAMNDYGFELLSDKKLDIHKIISIDLFSTKNLFQDIQGSINAVEMAKRKFRDVALISGLIFTGFPGKLKKERHLQSSTELIFSVFHEYEPDNLLYLQTYDEVMTFQLEEKRMRSVLNRIKTQKIIIKTPEKPTPFSFPLLVDRLREKMSSESLEERIAKMKLDG